MSSQAPSEMSFDKKKDRRVEPQLCPAFSAAVATGGDDGLELAHHLAGDAASARATDIHIDPVQDGHRVRVRIDGGLHEVTTVRAKQSAPLVRAIRVAAGIEAGTHPHKVEGTATLGAGETPFRVAYASTVLGPKLSMRLLDGVRIGHQLSELGMTGEEEKALLEWSRHGEGMVLSVGPTGCGKTTTCYALLREVLEQQRQRNVITLEDPVEYVLQGLVQIQIDEEDPGRPDTFAEGVHQVLRHDPDMLFLGEIRDEGTARAAIDASFSGHVLLSTMHARDPAGAVTLLRSMGIKNYEIAASLRIVIGQRTLRLVCPECGEQRVPSTSELKALEEMGEVMDAVTTGKGCQNCGGTGYRGQSAVFEIWQLGDDSYEAIISDQDEKRLRKLLRSNGVKSMRSRALELARSGRTTLEEALALR